MTEHSGVSFIGALIAFLRALPSRPNHTPKAPAPNTITLRTSFQNRTLCGGGGGTTVYGRGLLHLLQCSCLENGANGVYLIGPF